LRISPNWLKQFVSFHADERKLADALTLAGISVESIVEMPRVAKDPGKTAHHTGSAEERETVTFYEMEITTNRPDAMCHYGVAREVSAIYNTELKPLTAKLPAPQCKSTISVTIDNPELCARFTGQEIRNVKIGPSHGEVIERFRDLEQKPINSAADATNYVLLMMGKPTHAFDADKLAGGKIIVRNARPGESLRTLDGVDRKLHPEDLVIADAEKPVALAGIMGGWDSMITESTKNIFIESAWFDPTAIRKTARRHAMHTDASHIFERGADWASTVISTELVAQTILESGGQRAGDIFDVIARKVGHTPVQLRLSEVKRILGKDIPTAEIERMLAKLGFKVTAKGSGAYSVEIPTWRLDVEREIDVIEEIARVHGYDKFPNTLPSFSEGVVELPTQERDDKLRSTLLALGYNEALSSTFIAREESQRFSKANPVIIANPLSEEASAMRTTLVSGMLDMIGRNLNRGVNEVRLFEHGHIYSMQGATTDEHDSLCLGVTASALGGKDAHTIFRILKGDLEDLLSAFAGELSFDAETPDYFHPGRSARARLNCLPVAHFGQVSPDVASARKLKQDVYIAEIFVEQLYRTDLRRPRYQKLSRFPAVERDFSFLFSDEVSFAQIAGTIIGLRIPELRSVQPEEIFRGGNLGQGKYSVLVRATFQSNERTLRDDEVNAWSAQIIEALKSLGGQQR
jgi:phenylalanyl-tRNA synthetase beta chain